MNILLIEPPPLSRKGNLRVLGSFGTPKCEIVWAPLDLMIVSGFLEKNGIPSEIFDAHAMLASITDVKKKIVQVNPDIVIFCTSTTSICSDLRIADVAKEVSKDITTVAIGTHIMALPEETMKLNKNLDIAVWSEPELPILELIKNNLKPDNIKGLCFRNNGAIIKNEPHPLCQNLDEFGFPSHNKVPFHLYRDPIMKRRPMTLTAAQRGCINACIFCCNPLYGNYRKRSVGHVIAELKWMMELGIKEVNFFDPGMTHDLKWSEELFNKMIEEKIDITWKGNSRADKFSYDIARLMKESGCHSVQIGAESADLNILKNIGKNITPDMVKEAVNNAKRAGLQVLVYFSLGWPGETKQTMQKTIDFATSLDADFVTFGISSPHPGTLFFKYLEENNFFATKDWEKFDPLSKPVFNYPQLSGEEIQKAVLQGYRSFYLRPSYIIKKCLRQRSMLEIRNNYRNLMEFLTRYLK